MHKVQMWDINDRIVRSVFVETYDIRKEDRGDAEQVFIFVFGWMGNTYTILLATGQKIEIYHEQGMTPYKDVYTIEAEELFITTEGA